MNLDKTAQDLQDATFKVASTGIMSLSEALAALSKATSGTTQGFEELRKSLGVRAPKPTLRQRVAGRVRHTWTHGGWRWGFAAVAGALAGLSAETHPHAGPLVIALIWALGYAPATMREWVEERRRAVIPARVHGQDLPGHLKVDPRRTPAAEWARHCAVLADGQTPFDSLPYASLDCTGHANSEADSSTKDQRAGSPR